jgi:predicted alpha/beta hydrolase family esterase
MKNAFIIHGAVGHPQENWIPWLKSELEKLGYTVTVPQFPTPEGQSLANWQQVFEPYKKDITNETLIIGHSIAAAFILSVLEQIHTTVKGAFLVSGFIDNLGEEFFDNINHTFYKKQFNWDKIKKNHIVLFHGDNDPYVPMERAMELSEKVGSLTEVIENGGHLNEKAGFKKFDLLLEKIKEVAA